LFELNTEKMQSLKELTTVSTCRSRQLAFRSGGFLPRNVNNLPPLTLAEKAALLCGQ